MEHSLAVRARLVGNTLTIQEYERLAADLPDDAIERLSQWRRASLAADIVERYAGFDAACAYFRLVRASIRP